MGLTVKQVGEKWGVFDQHGVKQFGLYDTEAEAKQHAAEHPKYHQQHMTEAVTKDEQGTAFPAAAYAYVPDPSAPSTWKLRLWEDPTKKVTARQVGMAVAALGKGFRGQRVQIPAKDLAAVKAKVRAAWKAANPDAKPADLPGVLKEAYSDQSLEGRAAQVRDEYSDQMTSAAGDANAVSPGTIEAMPYILEVRDASLIVCQDGDYFEVPYTMDDQGACTFGEASPVKLAYIAESVQAPARPVDRMMLLEPILGRLMENGTPLPEGSVWSVRVIAPGFSRNLSAALGLKRYYPAEVLRESAPLFDGVRIFQHEAAAHVGAHARRAQDCVGWLSAPHYDQGIVAEFRCVDARLRQKLTEAFQLGRPDIIGFSINAPGREEAGLAEGVRAAIVRQIGRPDSVDVVSDPAAGGEFVRLVASVDPPATGGTRMDLQKLLAKIKSLRPDLVATEPAGGWTEESLTAKLEEALAPAAASAPLQESLRQTQEQLTSFQRQVLVRDRRQVVERALDLSAIGKSAPARTAVVKRIEGALALEDPKAFDAALTEAIQDQVAVVQSLGDAGKITGLGRASVSQDERDKHEKAMDGMLEGKDVGGVPRFRSLHESYAIVAGLRGMERVNPQQMLREAIFYQPRTEYGLPNPLREAWVGLRESVSSSTWGSMLGDSVTRRMIQYYSVEDLQIWRKVVSNIEGPKDFRTLRRERFGGYGTLPTVSQGNPYQPLASPTDQEATYAITKRGGTEDLTIETLANDDLGVVRNIPGRLGRAAGRTLKLFVFNTLIGNNPNIYDGTALAVAGHNNITTSALTDSTIKTAIQAMRNQAGYGDVAEILGGSNSPRWLLIPNPLEDISFRLTRSERYVGATNEAGTTPNLIAGRYGSLDYLVIDDWSDANNWWLVADPAKQPTIEIGFWNGQEEPEIFVQDQPLLGSVFTADKVTYKIRHVYSGCILDHRMFYGGIVP